MKVALYALDNATNCLILPEIDYKVETNQYCTKCSSLITGTYLNHGEEPYCWKCWLPMHPEWEALREEYERRKQQISLLDRDIKNSEQLVLEQLQKDMAQFEQYGLFISDSIVKNLFATLLKRESETLSNFADQHYNLGNEKFLEAMISPEEKAHKTKEFYDMLLEGVNKYFEQLSNTCEFISTCIGDYVNRHIAHRNAQIKRYTADMQNLYLQIKGEEKQKAEIQNQLQRMAELKKLFASSALRAGRHLPTPTPIKRKWWHLPFCCSV